MASPSPGGRSNDPPRVESSTTFEADFLAQYRDRLSAEHLRALAAMKQCRTPRQPEDAARSARMRAPQPGSPFLRPSSLPALSAPREPAMAANDSCSARCRPSTFLLTFTLPAEFRALAWAHQQSALRSSDALRLADACTPSASNDRQLQGTPGAIAVLHTNTRRLRLSPPCPSGHAGGRDRRRAKALAHQAAAAGQRHAICSTTRRWRRCFGRRCWPASKRRAWRCRLATRSTGWSIANRSAAARRRSSISGAISTAASSASKDIVACDNGQVSFRYRERQDRQVRTAHSLRRAFPVAGPAACVAQGLSARAQFRLSASELQAPDRVAARVAEVRSRPNHPMDQATRADPVRLLWRGDDDRENTDSTHGLHTHHDADSHSGDTLIV